MKEFWNERYGSDIFVYGKEPNRFFSTRIRELAPGKLLLPGEGEGRNAVYAASLGWEVEAFDQSINGMRKAEQLAEERGVRIKTLVLPVEVFPFRSSAYDAVGLVFVHLVPDIRKGLHQGVIQSLHPGGVVILEAFHTSQIHNHTGGPRNLEMLYDRELILADFAGLDHLELEELRVTIDEGPFHQGEADVIRYMGRKS